MSKRIVLVHAVMAAIAPITEAFRKQWAAAECANLLDDSLSTDRGGDEQLSPRMFERFAALSSYARLIGADGLLFTCSAFGPAIEAVARSASHPVLKPNEAMYEAALEHGTRIGMVATFAPAVAPMEREFYELAEQRRAQVKLETLCVPEAMAALRRGDAGAHNSLVAAAAQDLARCDVVMLAQFSTSRAENDVAARIAVPVLTSPGSAVRKMRSLLEPS